MSERALPVLLLLALGVVVFQQAKLGNFPPMPQSLVGVAIVFTLLALLAILSPAVAAAFALAVVIYLIFAYRGQLTPPGGATAR